MVVSLMAVPAIFSMLSEPAFCQQRPQSKLRASIELTVQSPIPDGENEDLPTFGENPKKIVRAVYRDGFLAKLKSLGFEEYVKQFTYQSYSGDSSYDYDMVTQKRTFVRDPKTRAIFEVKNDAATTKRPFEADPRMPVVEITSPPMWAEQVQPILDPLYSASSRLGWNHTLGGGHLNFDIGEFQKHPTRFVNLLTALHNNPLAERIFMPAEGEPTVFQRHHQDEFIHAVNVYRALPAIQKTWKSLLILFQPLLYEKPSSLILQADEEKLARLEVRPIGNQKTSYDVRLQLSFYQHIWDRLSDVKVDKPFRWKTSSYIQNIDHRNINVEGPLLFEQFGMNIRDYEHWINDYAKTRRRSMERLVAQYEATSAWLAEHNDPDLRNYYLRGNLSLTEGTEFLKRWTMNDYFSGSRAAIFNLSLLNYEIDPAMRKTFLRQVVQYFGPSSTVHFYPSEAFHQAEEYIKEMKPEGKPHDWETLAESSKRIFARAEEADRLDSERYLRSPPPQNDHEGILQTSTYFPQSYGNYLRYRGCDLALESLTTEY